MDNIYHNLVTLRISHIGKVLYDPHSHKIYNFAGTATTFVDRNKDEYPYHLSFQVLADITPELRSIYRRFAHSSSSPSRIGDIAVEKFIVGVKSLMKIMEFSFTKEQKMGVIESMMRFFSLHKKTLLCFPAFMDAVINRFRSFVEEGDWDKPAKWLEDEFGLTFLPCSGVHVTLKRLGRHGSCITHGAEAVLDAGGTQLVASVVHHYSNCCVCGESHAEDIEKTEWYGTVCGHVMCMDCATHWGRKRKRAGCPMCRNTS